MNLDARYTHKTRMKTLMIDLDETVQKCETMYEEENKLAKLGDAIAPNLKLSLTDLMTDPPTVRGNC